MRVFLADISKCAWSQISSRAAGLVAVALVISAVCGPCGRAQTPPPFSSSADYQSMLEELHHDPVRPSSMSAGTLLTSNVAPVSVQVDETAASLRLETARWLIVILKPRWGMSLTNKEKGLTWRLAGPDLNSAGIQWGPSGAEAASLSAIKVESINRSGNTWRINVGVDRAPDAATLEIAVISPSVIRLSIHAPRSVSGDTLHLKFAGGGPFFGLGERFAQVKVDGLKTILRPEDLFGKPDHNWTYIPVPFLFTPRGLGFFLDTAAVSTFDLSRANQQQFGVQLDAPSVDCYFFVGGPKEQIEDYTALTGRTPLAPPWAYGVWICSYQGPDRVLADARRLRQEKIPSSAVWLFDAMGQGDIMGWPLWWTGYYPNPRRLTDQLHNLGFKALTYIHPYVRSVLDPYNLPNPAFEEGERAGLFVLNSENKPTGPGFEPYVDGNIDFTSARNVDWWQKKIRTILIDDNFDGWMGDFGEWVNSGDRFASGATGRLMANLNPLFYHKITYEISREAKPDVVPFVRSGYAGSQGYTRVVWGGDQHPDWSEDNGLPAVVRAGITAGLSGFSVWGPDIDGNGFSNELWTRWVEFGALTSIMRDHLWDNPEGSVKLWHDAETIDIFRRYARLHVSLFPYFYTYAQKAEETGLPIIRHPFLEFPDDPKTYDANEEYLLGEKILVAPVLTKGATTRSLYLPKGKWVDYWTGKTIDGGRHVTVAAPLKQIPILVRAGSIVPLISPDTQTLAPDSSEHAAGKDEASVNKEEFRKLTGSITWKVFPAAVTTEESFTLYDGTTAVVRQEKAGIQVHVDHSQNVREYTVELPMTNRPREVSVDGKAIDELDGADRSGGKEGWKLNSASDSLDVFVTKDNFELSVAR